VRYYLCYTDSRVPRVEPTGKVATVLSHLHPRYAISASIRPGSTRWFERKVATVAHTDAADLEALGTFIRDRRHSLRLTQTQLANRFGWVQEKISILEWGKYGTPRW
jgi:hypothetical protein